ncbi:MAG: Gfo/Idh/MocA family oxidoreductase [Elusimicrobiota bacterium]
MSGARVRLGLIGAGRWGRAYIKSIALMPDAVLARVSSRNPQTSALVGPSCKVTDNWQALLRSGDLDGVIVATPPGLHGRMTIEAIENNIPVLVEKPLTLNLAEARDVLKMAVSRQALVLTEHTYLFHPAYQILKERRQDFGRLKKIKTVSGNYGPFRKDAPPLWDWASHDIAVCLDFTGTRPLAIRAECQDSQPTFEGPGQNFRLDIEFPEGILADIHIGNLMKLKQRRFEFIFDSQAAVIDDLSASKLTLNDWNDGHLKFRSALEVGRTPPLTKAIESFIQAIRSGSRDLFSLKMGVDVVAVLDACDSCLSRPGREWLPF